MNFNQLQAKVQQYMSKAQVKELFGDLRRKETWEAAYASLGETIAATADAAKDAIDTAALLIDNSETLDETIDAAISAAKTTIYWIKVVCYFFYFAGQTLSQWYADNQVDAKITAKVTEIKATKSAFQEGRKDGFAVPSWVAKSARVAARINKRLLEGLSLAATPHGLAFVMADLGS